MRRVIVFLFFVLFLYACKKDAPHTVLPIRFQRDMSVDSTKKLVENAGWQTDTEKVFIDSSSKLHFLELKFKNLQFSNVQDSFTADLLFINNRLFHAQLSAEPLFKLGPDFIRKKIHSRQEYNELVHLMETVYGPPRNRRTFIDRINNIGDTVFYTDWDTIENGRPDLAAVRLDLNGLGFVAN